MSGQQIGTVVGGVVGAVIGFYAGGNVYEGAQLGMAIGGAIGGAVDPTKVYGPHVGDGQAQSATDGSPISWVMGTAWVAGCIVDLGASREFSVKDEGQGKGSGTETYHYEAHQNFSILVCESDEIKASTIDSVLMVEQDGKIVYDVRPESTMLEDSNKWLARNCRFYYGDEAQLPLSDYDGDHGVGNEPAYRGVLLAFFTQFNTTAAGGRIPNFRFLVSSKSSSQSAIVLTEDAIITTSTPYGVTQDQSHIIGGYKDFTFSETATQQIVIKSPTLWAYSRYVVVIYTSPPVPSESVGLGADDVSSILDISGAYDSGWIQGGGPVNDWSAAWTYLGRTAPAFSTSAPADVIISAPPGQRIYGARLYNMFYFGSFDANPQQPDIEACPSPAGVNLTYVGDGYSAGDDGNAYRFPWADPDATLPAQNFPISLSQIISSICARGGLTPEKIDVTALSAQTVQGYTIAKQMNAVNALGPLLGSYFAYASEYDGKLNFKFYGADAVMTIDEADVLEANDANEGNITADLRNNATEFPKRIIGQYYDPAQNYMPVTVMQVRRAAGITATGDLAFDIPVVMDANTAQQTVDKAMKVAYAQLEGTLEFSVPFAGANNVYLSLVTGDPVLFRGKRWIVTEAILSAGYIKLTLQYDRQSAYTSDVQAIPGLDPTPPQSRYSGPTTLIPMNLPDLRTQDTYGIYLAAKGTNDQASWRGCNVEVSYDGQVSWQNAATITLASTLGTVTIAEPAGGEPLTVNVGAGTLESVTTDQLAARMNAFALVNGDTAEIGQFQTATQQTDGTWQLTTVSRGLLGTTEVPATAGQPFTMLDSVYFLPIDISFAGKTIAFRATGFGEDSSASPIETITYNPDTTVIIDGGEVT